MRQAYTTFRVGNFSASSPQCKFHYNFYEIQPNQADDSCITAIWEKRVVNGKGWHKRPPVAFGVGVPSETDNSDGYYEHQKATEYPPDAYELTLHVFQDGSGVLKRIESTDMEMKVGISYNLADLVTEETLLEFDKGSFLDSKNKELTDLISKHLKRRSEISHVSNLLETGEATTDDWWDAVFSSLEWCEYELKQLDFYSDYDDLYEIVESAQTTQWAEIPQAALNLRTITPETDTLEHDERSTVVTALRYREQYKHSPRKRVCFGTLFKDNRS